MEHVYEDLVVYFISFNDYRYNEGKQFNKNDNFFSLNANCIKECFLSILGL